MCIRDRDRTVPAPSPQVKEDPPAAREPTPKQPSKDTHPKRQAQSKPRKDCRSPAVRTRASGREHPVPSGSTIGDVAPVAQAAVVENPSPSSEALVKTAVTLRSAVTSHDGVTDGPSKGRAVPPAAQSPKQHPRRKISTCFRRWYQTAHCPTSHPTLRSECLEQDGETSQSEGPFHFRADGQTDDEDACVALQNREQS